MRLSTLHPQRRRAGLTLVEMLIALALSIFIMSILSEAFVKGLEAFGQYKALADLEQRLRTVANIIRRDLRAPHFDSSKKLSELTASGKPMPVLDGLSAQLFTPQQALALHQQLAQYRMVSPAQGFFAIEEWPNGKIPGIGTTIYEGEDSFGRPSYRDQMGFNAAGNLVLGSDVLHFTSRLEGNDPDKYFYGKVRNGSPLDGIGRLGGLTRYDSPGNQLFTSQAAELLYFMGLDDSANLPGVSTANGPVLTFNLYRQAWLLVPDQFSNGQPYNTSNPQLPAGTPTTTLLYDAPSATFFADNDLSAVADTISNTPVMVFNTMSTVQHKGRRRGAGTIRSPRINSATGGLDGSDIMLTNVISFDVKVFDPFAYKMPMSLPAVPTLPAPGIVGPISGRGAYVDIGDVIQTSATGVNPRPTAAGDPNDALQPNFGGPLTPPPGPPGVPDSFDTGTSRLEGTPGTANLSSLQTPLTHRYPFTSIQITIRVYEPKSRQTRQITIIQDM